MDDICWKCGESFTAEDGRLEKVNCVYCGYFFHWVCAGIDITEVGEYVCGKNVIWNCDTCTPNREKMLQLMHNFLELQKITIEQKNWVAELSKQVKKLSEELNKIKKPVFSINNGVNSSSNTPTLKRTFAEVIEKDSAILSPMVKKVKRKNVVKPKVKESVPVIVIQNARGINRSSGVETLLKAKLNPLVDPVFDMRTTTKNKVVLKCKDESAYNVYKEKISSMLGTDYVVDKPKERKYALKFVGVPKDMEKEELLTCIGEQNNYKDIVKKLSVHRISNGIAYVETDSDTYKLLLAKEKVIVMWSIVRIESYVNIVRCFKCQQIGHTSINCGTDNKQVCVKCSGEHDISNCESEIICCVNCSRENKSTGSSNPTEHYAWSGKCPTILNELKRLKALKEPQT